MKSKIVCLSKNNEFKEILRGKKKSNKYFTIFFKKLSNKDKNKLNIKKINNGTIPFLEKNSQKLLKTMIKKKRIYATNQLRKVIESKFIIVCIGTPINNKLNPNLRSFINFF